MQTKISNFDEWREVTEQIYRYDIALHTHYEIHILHHAHDSPIMEATANLYIVGEYVDLYDNKYFQRDSLLSDKTVKECLEVAEKDFIENVRRKDS